MAYTTVAAAFLRESAALQWKGAVILSTAAVFMSKITVINTNSLHSTALQLLP
jgi:hypothetical protein